MGGADIVMASIAFIARNPLITWHVVGQREADNLLSMVTAPIVGPPVRQGVPWLSLVMHHHEKGIPLSLDIESQGGSAGANMPSPAIARTARPGKSRHCLPESTYHASGPECVWTKTFAFAGKSPSSTIISYSEAAGISSGPTSVTNVAPGVRVPLGPIVKSHTFPLASATTLKEVSARRAALKSANVSLSKSNRQKAGIERFLLRSWHRAYRQGVCRVLDS